MTPKDFLKNVLTPMIGFGLAGALWGHSVFVGEVKLQHGYGTPFPYVLGAIFLGILGSVSLVLFSGSWKKILQMIGFGMLAWIVAFTLPRIWEYPLAIYGGLALTLPLYLFGNSGIGERLDFAYLGLRPSMGLANFWIEFFLAGVIVSAAYLLILKGKSIKRALFGATWFALASIVSPILGNIAGNVFDSLFTAYLVTFSFIGIVLGASFVWGLKNNGKNP